MYEIYTVNPLRQGHNFCAGLIGQIINVDEMQKHVNKFAYEDNVQFWKTILKGLVGQTQMKCMSS